VGERLESWKEIATYLGREVRTVQRWAIARSLPVHRLPGGGVRPRVFSLESELDAWLGTDPPREDVVSVAVLPFLNLAGGVDDQYFADGLADDVINALVRMPGLRVTARTSSFAFTERGRDVREIGARLRAAWLIEGSVRRDRNRVRVSVQLVSARDGYHAWSECYDRQLADVFAIQDEIARSVASALNVKLSLHAPVAPHPQGLAAYDLWVKGRSISQQYMPASFAQARDCYEAAIALDPTFARPYFGLADLLFYGVQFGVDPAPGALDRARDAIVRSLELDDRFGEGHALLGVFRGLLDYDWAGAEESFQRAFALSPGSAAVLINHAWYHLVPRMRIAQALDEAQQAVALDPLSPMVHGLLGLVWVVARQYSRGADECRRAVELAPGLWWLHWFYGTALLLQGRLVLGFRHARQACEQVRRPLVVGAMSGMYGVFLRRKRAKVLLAELQGLARAGYVPPAAFALAYLGLGDDRTFEWFDKAIDARDPIATHLPSMPIYDAIRDDPRFQALLARMHLA
jgi:TolB-like protein/tetratricopeptide (TPR) repeat protein